MTLTELLTLISGGSVGTLLLGLLKYRADMRAAAVAAAKQQQEYQLALQQQQAAQTDTAADNERELRAQLFEETRTLRKELTKQQTTHDREIAAIRQEAAKQRQDAALEQRALSMELKTVRSHVMKSQTDIRDLTTQLYQMNTYWGEVHRIAMLLYPVEWTQILAQVRVPKPEWQPRPPDQLPTAPDALEEPTPDE